MKTVRFSQVVEKCGKPDVYLLMSETDSVFQKALGAGKIMSLTSGHYGTSPESGSVGYDKKRNGQLLIFPKSLKAFTDSKVVGIKYDLLAKAKTTNAPLQKKQTRKSEAKRPSQKTLPKPKTKSTNPKIVPFTPEDVREEHDEEESQLKAFVRQAIKALERGNSVAAYNLLKQIIP